MSASNPKAELKRLVDMLVEEVSFVDRPANRQRFLIVKRSTDMGDENQSGTTGGESTANQEDEQSGNPDENNSIVSGAEESSATSDGVDLAEVVTSAVDALESLTDAVDALSENSSNDQLEEIADQFRSIADGLALQHSAVKPNGDSIKPNENTSPAASTGLAEQSNQLLETLNGLKEIMGPLADALKAGSFQKVAPQPPKKKKKPEDESEEEAPLAKLSELTSAIGKLVEVSKGQQQRLTRIEKRFGLPNSAQPGGQSSGGDSTVSWPLDLNTPVDKNSVDASMSFHDDNLNQ